MENRKENRNNVLIIEDERFETSIDIHSEFDLKLANLVFDMILEERPDDLPPMPAKMKYRLLLDQRMKKSGLAYACQ